MDEYLQTLEIFYDEKMKYLTKKDKYIKCNECSDEKIFTEKENELILSCGKDDGKCGPQIIIELPEYLNYETKIDELKNSLNNKYNWDALEKYLNVSKELEESREKQKNINEEISRIEKMFFEENMEIKQKELQKFYDQRIKKTKKCKELEKKLQNISLNEIQKKELRQEYVRTVQEINNEYKEIKDLMEDINPFLVNKLPKVTIKHENYIYEKKKVKKSDVKEEFVKNMKVSWVFKGKSKYGIITELKGKGALVKDEKGKEKIRLLTTLTPVKEVKEKEDIKKEENVIKYFSRSKDNKWLSTFNKANPFEYEGLTYPTVEHAFHAQKVNDEKKDEYQLLFTKDDVEPSEAKKMGGKKYFTENNYTLRDDWNQIKLQLMEDITKIYYDKNPDMFEKLKETGDKLLIHTGFRIDDYWGVKSGKGENNHGKILMKIRNDL